jgi:hypothetical protein
LRGKLFDHFLGSNWNKLDAIMYTITFVTLILRNWKTTFEVRSFTQ